MKSLERKETGDPRESGDCFFKKEDVEDVEDTEYKEYTEYMEF